MTEILIAGDFVPCNRVERLFLNDRFDTVFDSVRTFTHHSDYSIINLEAPVVTDEALPIKKTGPNLKCSSKAIDALKYAGFDCVTLANNHFFDYGQTGVDDTLKCCTLNDVDFVGGGICLEQAAKTLFKKLNDKTFAFINVCESEWSVATNSKGGSAPLDTVTNSYQIQEAKRNADYVIVITHGGTEHYNLPSPRMKKTYRFFIDNGADVVVNHHQHCYSGYEKYNGKYIFYGLGNFCFDRWNGTETFWNEGFLLKLSFDQTVSPELIPYRQCAESPDVDFDTDTNAFFQSIETLNNIISDDTLLQKHYDELVEKKSRNMIVNLEPYDNKYLQYFREKGLLPSFITQKKYRLLLNLFRCESHRDIMLQILENKVK